MTILIGDIGGTNARFALVDVARQTFTDERSMLCDDFPSSEAAIGAYLETVGAEAPEVICLAVAGPIVDHAVDFMNNAWRISVEGLCRTFGCARASLLNDFEAVAWSTTALESKDRRVIGEIPVVDPGDRDYSVCVIGPGTGLGGAGLVSRNGAIAPVITEVGHVGFAPEDDRQLEVLKLLQSRYGRVSDERVISGSGIRNLYWALSQVHGQSRVELSEAEIFERKSDDEVAAVTVDLFFELLGQACGNLVLSLGAFDGAYVAGGIAQRHHEALLHSSFRRGFEHKGRHQQLMASVPTELIVHPQPGLLGAAQVALRASES
jgi:glucokinase